MEQKYPLSDGVSERESDISGRERQPGRLVSSEKLALAASCGG